MRRTLGYTRIPAVPNGEQEGEDDNLEQERKYEDGRKKGKSRHETKGNLEKGKTTPPSQARGSRDT